MPLKDIKKRRAYQRKYNRLHPVSPEKRHFYYIEAKKREFRKISRGIK